MLCSWDTGCYCTHRVLCIQCVFSHCAERADNKTNGHVVMNVQWTHLSSYQHIYIFPPISVIKHQNMLNFNLNKVKNFYLQINLEYRSSHGMCTRFMNSLQNVNNAPRHHSTTIYTRWPKILLPFYSFWLCFTREKVLILFSIPRINTTVLPKSRNYHSKTINPLFVSTTDFSNSAILGMLRILRLSARCWLVDLVTVTWWLSEDELAPPF